MTDYEAIQVVDELLHIETMITKRGTEIKVLLPDLDNGGLTKAYLDANDCAKLSEAFAVVATRLLVNR